MAGLFKRFTKFVLGGEDEKSLEELLKKIDTYESDNVRLYTKDPMTSALVEMFGDARVTFNYNESNGKFTMLVENLDSRPDDDEDEKEFTLPITKEMKWEVYSPQTDDEPYACGHIFDYSKKKEKGVQDGTFQLEFTHNEKTTTIDQFETLLNDILDFIEKEVSKVACYHYQHHH